MDTKYMNRVIDMVVDSEDIDIQRGEIEYYEGYENGGPMYELAVTEINGRLMFIRVNNAMSDNSGIHITITPIERRIHSELKEIAKKGRKIGRSIINCIEDGNAVKAVSSNKYENG